MFKNFLQIQLKLLQKKTIQKTAEATGYLIGNKTADKITKVSKRSSHNCLEKVESETENTGSDREMQKERDISPEEDPANC